MYITFYFLWLHDPHLITCHPLLVNQVANHVHIVVGSSFISNISSRKYFIRSSGFNIDLDSKMLISCVKCGFQYIGKTSQTLHCRLNNHCNRIKQLCNLYLYNHFNSNRRSIDYLKIMSIEKVALTVDDNKTLASKILDREKHWIREIGCIYPYDLNDNIHCYGNISKHSECMVVYNKQPRKYRSRNSKRVKRKPNNQLITANLVEI